MQAFDSVRSDRFSLPDSLVSRSPNIECYEDPSRTEYLQEQPPLTSTAMISSTFSEAAGYLLGAQG